MIYLLVKLSFYDFIDYSTDKLLYKSLDSFIERENLHYEPDYQWVRGYQGLWIEIKKIKKIVLKSNRGRDNKENYDY